MSNRNLNSKKENASHTLISKFNIVAPVNDFQIKKKTRLWISKENKDENIWKAYQRLGIVPFQSQTLDQNYTIKDLMKRFLITPLPIDNTLLSGKLPSFDNANFYSTTSRPVGIDGMSIKMIKLSLPVLLHIYNYSL